MAKKLEIPPWATNEVTKAYWRTVAPNAGMSGWASEAPPPVEAEYCHTCGNAGFVRALPHDFQPGGAWQEAVYVTCPSPTCHIKRASNTKKYGAVTSLSAIPSEYKKMDFAKWDRLMQKGKPKGNAPHVMDKKRDAYGAARAFVLAHQRGFRFTRAEAAAQAGLQPEENVNNTASLNAIVYSGTYGVGKTSLACAIANACMELFVQVVYVRMDTLFLALRDTFNTDKKGETEGKVINLYKSAPVLIIDELPLTASDWQREVGGGLIDHRLANGLPTIITTNVPDADALVTAWGRLIADRITAMSHWYVLGGVQLRPRYEARESR